MKDKILKRRKAQVKIQETAFMLLALAFFFILVLIFYSNYQLKQLYAQRGKLQSEEAISLLEKFVALPEFSCLHGSCIDLDKLLGLRNVTGYDDLWKGTSKIEVVQIYPSRNVYTIYQKGKQDITYSTFVPLCKTRYLDGYVWQECSLAKLLVSIEKTRLR
jgi:hypothetical protein